MKPEDSPKVIAKFKKRTEPGGENLIGAGLKTLFGPCHIGLETKGFTILETDNAVDLANFSSYYLPELTMKIYPINDSKEMVASWHKYHQQTLSKCNL
jgi:hypothetical protein